MESMSRGDAYWTLGGWESPRLQTARYRAVRDGFFVPWKEFSEGTIEQWKANPDISRLYSQAAGVTHFMLDSLGAPKAKEERELALMQGLIAVYAGQPDSRRVVQLLGNEQAQENYEKALVVTDEQVMSLRDGHEVKELVLAGSQLNANSWKRVLEQRRLEWLDLSFTNATSDDLRGIGELKKLERLSVEGSAVDGTLLGQIRDLKELTELDLTGCAIDDAGLEALKRHPSIKTLWLGKTRVSEAMFPTLASMPKLEFVDVSETQVSDAAWGEFVKSKPKLRQSR